MDLDQLNPAAPTSQKHVNSIKVILYIIQYIHKNVPDIIMPLSLVIYSSTPISYFIRYETNAQVRFSEKL